MDLGDLGDAGDDDALGDFKDLFAGDDWGPDQPGSPGSPGKRNSMSQPNSPSGAGGGAGGTRSSADMFRYGQEGPGERLEFLQQPLALGYLVSTAKTGTMPKWFWSSCPHMEDVCPVFLKSALHINTQSLGLGSEDGFANPGSSSSGRMHSLDSSYTTDVLR